MSTKIFQEQEKKKADIVKSKSAGNNWTNVGPQPSLAQMKSIRSKNASKKEVMNAAAMVLHAVQNGKCSSHNAPQQQKP